jgi:hypothetical protein
MHSGSREFMIIVRSDNVLWLNMTMWSSVKIITFHVCRARYIIWWSDVLHSHHITLSVIQITYFFKSPISISSHCSYPGDWLHSTWFQSGWHLSVPLSKLAPTASLPWCYPFYAKLAPVNITNFHIMHFSKWLSIPWGNSNELKTNLQS